MPTEIQHSLNDLVDSFFDANVLAHMRNIAIATHAPLLYMMELKAMGGPIMTWDGPPPSQHLIEMIKAFARDIIERHNILPKDRERVFNQLCDVMSKHARDIKAQIHAKLEEGSVKTKIWSRDAAHIWTVDRKAYALFFHRLAGSGVYYILHLSSQSIVYIEGERMIDYAILKLLHAQVPIYTSFPWPPSSLNDLLRRANM